MSPVTRDYCQGVTVLAMQPPTGSVRARSAPSPPPGHQQQSAPGGGTRSASEPLGRRAMPAAEPFPPQHQPGGAIPAPPPFPQPFPQGQQRAKLPLVPQPLPPQAPQQSLPWESRQPPPVPLPQGGPPPGAARPPLVRESTQYTQCAVPNAETCAAPLSMRLPHQPESGWPVSLYLRILLLAAISTC